MSDAAGVAAWGGGLFDPQLFPRGVVEGPVGERLGLSREGVALTREELGLGDGVTGFLLSLMAGNAKLGDPKKAMAGFEGKAMWLNGEARRRKREADEAGHFSLGRGHQEATGRSEARLLALHGRRESRTALKRRGASELQQLDALAGEVLAREQGGPRPNPIPNPFEALHGMWRAYAARLVSHPSEVPLDDRLARMEWAGAKVEVARCKDAGHVGVRGIVALELKTAFALWVAPAERKTAWKRPLKVVPKRDAVFRVALPDVQRRKDGGAVRTDEAVFSRHVLVDGNALIDRGPSGRLDPKRAKGKDTASGIQRPQLLLPDAQR